MKPAEAILRPAVDTMFPTLFLLIPVMAASVLAGSTFVGERERHTLESILYAPITARELFVAKVVGAVVPGCAVTLASVLAFGVVVDAGSWALAGVLLFPTVKWALVVLWLAPAVALLALTLMVLVSARAQTFQEAQQFSVLVVLPIILLVIGQATGVMILGTTTLAVAGAVVFALDAFLVRLAAGRFTAERLL